MIYTAFGLTCKMIPQNRSKRLNFMSTNGPNMVGRNKTKQKVNPCFYYSMLFPPLFGTLA
jgi:hypothetical protein